MDVAVSVYTLPTSGKSKEMTVMHPVLAVEYRVKVGANEIKEESVPLHGLQEFLAYVAPGGGCERIPSEVDEIKMVFFSPQHSNLDNPLADMPVTLQLGMVFFSGPLSEVVRTAEELLDRAGRRELSGAFLSALGLNS
jgi:hypothetical protein